MVLKSFENCYEPCGRKGAEQQDSRHILVPVELQQAAKSPCLAKVTRTTAFLVSAAH